MSNASLDHLKYTLRHKKHVYSGGREIDLPRIQLLGHDLSKLRPSEFIPYKNYFYGERTPEAEEKFRQAVVKHHFQRNPHHPEYWRGQMPLKRKLEMVVDWYGAGKAQGTHRFGTFRSWYKKNRDKLQLDEESKREIDQRLGIV